MAKENSLSQNREIIAMIDDDFVLSAEDPIVDQLAQEFVRLKPIWADANNPDYVRSVEILKTLDQMNLSPWQNNQVATFIRLNWADATGQALSLGLIPNRPTGARVSQQVAGLCLAQARENAKASGPA
jgi:hypothetical protein